VIPRLVTLLFFLSGALALAYQVVWVRMMMHVFGSTAVAVGTVLAAWMAGMALGAWLIGKQADRHGNCLRLYAWLEIGIAVSALAAHLLLHQLGLAHRLIYDWVGASPFLFAAVRFLLAFVLIMLPTALMGATLPVLTRFLVRRDTLVGVNISSLYAANTFGAVAGVLLTGFFLIGRYGIHVPVYMAAAGNALVGLAAWLWSWSTRLKAQPGSWGDASGETPANSAISEQPGTATRRLILFGLGLSGLTSFAYEIYWTRSLVFILGNSTYALSTMLAAFLTGIALGGYLVRILIRRTADRAAAFGWLQLALGVFSALALPLLFSVSDPQSLNRYIIGASDQAMTLILSGFGIAFLVMLVPATLIGATFPLAGQVAAGKPGETGTMVGRVYAINTLGNVAGALLPGLILLNWLGIQKGIVAMAAINVGLGLLVLFVRLMRKPARPLQLAAVTLALILAVSTLSQAPIAFQFPSDGERPWSRTLFYREGPLATTKVYEDPRRNEKHISVDGIVIGGTGTSEFKQLLLAHLPKLLLDDVSRELSVGVGSGILLGESLRHPSVEQITGVEIEPSVIEGARIFEAENHGALDNPRLDVIVDDVGSFLRTDDNRYQVVSADEKTADEYASNGFSYSRDYYELLRNHLAEGGLVAQWVPTTLPPRQYRMVLKTFADTFPAVQVWYFLPAYKRGPFNTILVGSNEPITLDFEAMRARFEKAGDALANLVPYGLTSAESLLPHFVAGRDELLAELADEPVNSLEFPRYEFFYPWEYAYRRETQFIANHDLLISLKRAAFPAFLAGLEASTEAKARIRQTVAAEFRYLAGFRKFLEGMPLAEQYRVFDDALAVAPWNDSLRARIYAQYRYMASVSRDPAKREHLANKAQSLYATEQNQPAQH
jgi:spermidine synthase